jgi:hypothetical protein
MTSNYISTQTQIPRMPYGVSSEGVETVDTQSYILDRLEALTNQTGQLGSEVRNRPEKHNAQIRDLGEDGYKLTEALMITIEEYPGDDVVIACFPEVEAFGEGVTEAEAILNLKHSILDLYDELIETPQAELGALPQSWRKTLKILIQKD